MTQKEYATYTFPEDNLLYALVDLYFKEINTYLPLLHKPTFIAQLIARRHLADESFAPIVLLVCAVGARFTKDPRVLLEGSTSFHSGESCLPMHQSLSLNSHTKPGGRSVFRCRSAAQCLPASPAVVQSSPDR